MIYLKTERLIIRRVQADDWKSIQKIWADFNQSPMRVYDTPHDTEDAPVQRRIQKWAAFHESTEHMFFAVCLESAVIVIACMIFSAFASGSPANINESMSATNIVWSYIGETIFSMLILVGAIKMSDRISKEMLGL